MKIARRSLVYRLLVPIFAIIAVVTIVLLLLLSRIAGHILEDYNRATLTAYSDESKRILDSALVELTTARLLENHAVVEVKQETMIEALSLNWQSRGIEGIVVGPDGRPLCSTLPEDLTARISALPANGHFHIADDSRVLHGQSFLFPAWQWRIITLTHSTPSQASRREVVLLVPLVAIGSFLMLGLMFFLLQQRLRRPVAAMIADVSGERPVAPTGVEEFDQIGTAINEALDRVRERTSSILEKDERIRLLLDSSAEGIYGVDTRGVCTFCNTSCLRQLGYEDERELLGMNTHLLFHHSHEDGRVYEEQACRIYLAYQKGQRVHVDTEVFWRKDGSSFPVEYWSYPVLQGNTVVGAVVTFIDITDRKQAQDELREERNKFEAIISAMGDGISIQDRNFRILLQNDVHKGLVGSHEGERCYEAYESRKDPCAGCPIVTAIDDGKIHQSERTAESQGAVRHLEITTSPLRDAFGDIVAGIELVRDVTERRRTEIQLRQAQKMEAIGQLAGGIAHDFNNILTAITGYASFVKMRTEEGSQVRTYTDQILLASEKAAGMTRQILAFSRKQVLTPRPVRFNEIIRGMEKILLRLLGEDIEVRVELTEQDSTVLADPGQVEQVLLNLATNARDAMPAGGRLHISTQIALLSGETATDKGLRRSGPYVLTSFSDSGEGMSEKVRQRIFEPFFTTKEMGRGTGLGLAIVYGIISQHDGQISVYSEPGEGTTFRIYLPAALSSSARQTASAEAEAPGGTETILLAEDDEMVRDISRLTLEDAGYRVITASDGEDAVKQFLAHSDEVKLCLMDIIMPKKNGKVALDEIRLVKPDIRAIYISGYAADLIRSKDIIDSDTALLGKPVTPHDLLKKVRDVLNA